MRIKWFTTYIAIPPRYKVILNFKPMKVLRCLKKTLIRIIITDINNIANNWVILSGKWAAYVIASIIIVSVNSIIITNIISTINVGANIVVIVCSTVCFRAVRSTSSIQNNLIIIIIWRFKAFFSSSFFLGLLISSTSPYNLSAHTQFPYASKRNRTLKSFLHLHLNFSKSNPFAHQRTFYLVLFTLQRATSESFNAQSAEKILTFGAHHWLLDDVVSDNKNSSY